MLKGNKGIICYLYEYIRFSCSEVVSAYPASFVPSSGHTFTTFTFPSGAPSPCCLTGNGKADLASFQAAGMNIKHVHKTNLPP